MDTIFKYVLRVTDYQEIEMPSGAKIIHVHEQINAPCIWALVNTHKKYEVRKFKIHGTGHEIDLTNLNYVGSFLLTNQLFVGHLFEIV